ncbi:MAG TPA: amidophosphoribosyltransferase [Clostridia bacterium]|nr:amidophosphoribosyltransferase [Clostridia bacterium]
MNKLKEECGVFGIYAPGRDVARLAYYGLYALQHRGQESAGIAVSDGDDLHLHKGMGLVSNVFDESALKDFSGHLAIGHVRNSIRGSNGPMNSQPLAFRYVKGIIALAHNGSLVNTSDLRSLLYAGGAVFQTSSDCEVIANLIARHGHSTLEDSLMKCIIDIKGAYSLVLLTEDKLFAVRDPYGFRPLCIGEMGDGGYVVASESCALDIVGAKLIRDVAPGEIVVIDENGLRSIMTFSKRKAHCIFEYVYLARPDSRLDGFDVNTMRKEMGRQLARENDVDADVVIAVPDSGISAARSFAQESGIPYEDGLMKNRYVGRAFIQSSPHMRDLAVKLKLNAVRNELENKRIIMVDDSIVRGTTSGKIANMLRECGAKEVHVRISSPPVILPCYYGIDTSDESQLIAACKPVGEICKDVGADSLHYLSLEGLVSIFGEQKGDFCTACFSGDYPVPVYDK